MRLNTVRLYYTMVRPHRRSGCICVCVCEGEGAVNRFDLLCASPAELYVNKRS